MAIHPRDGARRCRCRRRGRRRRCGPMLSPPALLPALIFLALFLPSSVEGGGKGPIGLYPLPASSSNSRLGRQLILVADSYLDALVVIDIDPSPLGGGGGGRGSAGGGGNVAAVIPLEGGTSLTGVTSCPSCHYAVVSGQRNAELYLVPLPSSPPSSGGGGETGRGNDAGDDPGEQGDGSGGVYGGYDPFTVHWPRAELPPDVEEDLLRRIESGSVSEAQRAMNDALRPHIASGDKDRRGSYWRWRDSLPPSPPSSGSFGGKDDRSSKAAAAAAAAVPVRARIPSECASEALKMISLTPDGVELYAVVQGTGCVLVADASPLRAYLRGRAATAVQDADTQKRSMREVKEEREGKSLYPELRFRVVTRAVKGAYSFSFWGEDRMIVAGAAVRVLTLPPGGMAKYLERGNEVRDSDLRKVFLRGGREIDGRAAVIDDREGALYILLSMGGGTVARFVLPPAIATSNRTAVPSAPIEVKDLNLYAGIRPTFDLPTHTKSAVRLAHSVHSHLDERTIETHVFSDHVDGCGVGARFARPHFFALAPEDWYDEGDGRRGTGVVMGGGGSGVRGGGRALLLTDADNLSVRIATPSSSKNARNGTTTSSTAEKMVGCTSTIAYHEELREISSRIRRDRGGTAVADSTGTDEERPLTEKSCEELGWEGVTSPRSSAVGSTCGRCQRLDDTKIARSPLSAGKYCASIGAHLCSSSELASLSSAPHHKKEEEKGNGAVVGRGIKGRDAPIWVWTSTSCQGCFCPKPPECVVSWGRDVYVQRSLLVPGALSTIATESASNSSPYHVALKGDRLHGGPQCVRAPPKPAGIAVGGNRANAAGGRGGGEQEEEEESGGRGDLSSVQLAFPLTVDGTDRVSGDSGAVVCCCADRGASGARDSISQPRTSGSSLAHNVQVDATAAVETSPPGIHLSVAPAPVLDVAKVNLGGDSTKIDGLASNRGKIASFTRRSFGMMSGGLLVLFLAAAGVMRRAGTGICAVGERCLLKDAGGGGGGGKGE